MLQVEFLLRAQVFLTPKQTEDHLRRLGSCALQTAAQALQRKA